MNLSTALYGRRATRAFTREIVARAAIESLIDAAIQAPSAVNEQPWHFTVVQNAELLDHISAESKRFMQKLMQESKFPHHLHGQIEAPEFQIFYHAPALILISARGGDWAAENASLAAENLMLAAHANGLGSCWIGLAQRWLETEAGRQAVKLDDTFTPVAPIIVGHPAQKMPPVPRAAARVRWIN